jgi:transposase
LESCFKARRFATHASKVFAEFTFDQKLPTFIQSHEKMWQFFGGVTKYTVTDNLKSSVTRADIYEPDKNKTFTAYANHGNFAVLPARPYRPKDKANVECHAGLLQKTFFQKVRNRTFTSITELNEALMDFLHDLNNQVMKDHGVSRNERFELEKRCLQAVPTETFEIPEVKEATVHPGCHTWTAAFNLGEAYILFHMFMSAKK